MCLCSSPLIISIVTDPGSQFQVSFWPVVSPLGISCSFSQFSRVKSLIYSRPFSVRLWQSGNTRTHIQTFAATTAAIKPFHNRGQKTQFKTETGSEWIMVTVNGGSIPKISDRSDIGNRWFWAGFVSVRRAVRSVQLTPAGWQRPGGDPGIKLANVLLNHPSMHACNASSGQVHTRNLISG